MKLKEESINNIINKIIPKLNQNKIKGENGNVATIGGSLEYSGAPYYSAITALKAGSDLSHVFCHLDACIPIKCYSPELIVHPGFNNSENEELINKSIKNMLSLLFLINISILLYNSLFLSILNFSPNSLHNLTNSVLFGVNIKLLLSFNSI